MYKYLNKKYFFLVFLLWIVFGGSCSDDESTSSSDNDNIYDVDAKGIPKFVTVNYIDLSKIDSVSKFRSSEGHDYSDDFESCRSMKHYFAPKGDINWATTSINIYSPVKGKVIRAFQEWAGTQVQIYSDDYPAFYFAIFHINLANPLNEGDEISAGQLLGTHVGPATWSDIAVGVATPDGRKLVSYFDVMTDEVFQAYQARGLSSRSDVIIAKEARDADTLNCSGDSFLNIGQLERWVYLN
jgi:hypothetical protein